MMVSFMALGATIGLPTGQATPQHFAHRLPSTLIFAGPGSRSPVKPVDRLRDEGGQRGRVAMHLALVRRGVLSASGAVRSERVFARALVQVRRHRRWSAVRRAVPIGKGGSFSLRWTLKRGTSKVTARVIVVGGHGGRLVSGVTTLRLGARGSAAFSVPASTRVYVGKAVQSAEAGRAGETIVKLAPGSAKPVLDGHVALAPSSALPFGMFASVIRVSGSDSGWLVALRRAPIDQVLDDVSFHVDEDVTPHLVNALGDPVGSDAGHGAIQIAGRASFARNSSLGSVFDCKSSGRSETADRAFASSGAMPLSIELSNLHALDDFDAGSVFPHRDPFFLMQVHGEAKASIGFQAKSAFSCELSDSFRENHRLAVPLGAVGPVPVTMYLEPTLKFEVSASGSVSLSQRHYWAITLEQDGFSPFKARLSHSADPVDFHASAALGASLFTGGDLSVMFGAGEGSWAVQAGIYGAFGPDFELATSTDRPGCLTASARLEADLGVRLQVLVKRWNAQLASLTTKPVDLGGPWCLGGGGNGGSGSPGAGGAPGGGQISVTNAVSVSGGGFGDSCALLGDGGVACWGPPDSQGQMGGGGAEGESRSGPVRVLGISSATSVGAGETSSCAVVDAGAVRCWGYAPSGGLGNGSGDGSTTYSTVPVQVGGIADARQVSVGGAHACALLSGGSLKCWGANRNGQLGDGTTSGPETCGSDPCARTPVPVSGIANAKALDAGGQGTCAVLENGTVECWGDVGLSGAMPAPVEVGGIDNAVQVSAGWSQACALLSDGHIKCWGVNTDGELGDGTTNNQSGPVEVSGISNAVGVSSGGYFSCALLAGGSVKCWGSNWSGELGDGTETGPEACGSAGPCSTVPVAVVGLPPSSSVGAGLFHACAALMSGRVECWGQRNGGVGPFEQPDALVPVFVP